MLYLRNFGAGLYCLLSLAATCNAADLSLKGAENSALNFSLWNKDFSVWSKLDFAKNGLSVPLYDGGSSASIGLGANSTAISPNGKYAIIQRTVFGELHDSEKVTSTEKNYCDMISMDSGCVLLSRPAEACSGSWKEGTWSTDGGETIKPQLETISPKELIKSTSVIGEAASRAAAIKDQMFMGGDSYMSCYSPEKNTQALNDLGFYLAQAGDDASALKIYRGLESVGQRTVLMLNIADSLWNMKKTTEAVGYYKKYTDAMNAAGKSKKIPMRVFERIK
ncbi:hypothetical protein PSCICM_28390 [Pseudomonas cichorii]|uniref:Tetratricopeptide repeat protein n=1 Tax=Pseudomonas cichorii TaxID=36746 RepID=A0A3M4VVV8_PSECI|nr:hypothetical protein [Pseudomonas cichorii]RMR55112.1 hypothetical protein ALP84_01820 [Pseudomonas cichorii]GFM77020.1 hypothetical protein PSCICM_28390 [Pseudomonas cichorii]